MDYVKPSAHKSKGKPVIISRKCISLVASLCLFLSVACVDSARADVNLKFDRYLGVGIVAQESGRPAEALNAFKMAARNCTEATDDSQTLLERLLRAMQERPLDPNGHIAIALLYESFLRDPNRVLSQYADFEAAAEAELSYAVQLSPDRLKEEAQALLQEFEKFRAKDCHGQDKSRSQLLSELLTRSWKNNHEKFEAITRIKMMKLEDGSLLPSIIVPSSESALDQSVVSACKQSLNEYPMLTWADEEFEFVSGDKHRSVICVTHHADWMGQELRRNFGKPDSPQPNKVDQSLLDPLRKRITQTCITDYCRDDTQTITNYWAPDFPPIRNGAWMPPQVNEENRIWCNDLFPNSHAPFYGVNCLMFLANGKPVIYQLSTGGKTQWKVDIDADDNWTDCGEYFLRRRIRHQLFVSILRYQLAHCLGEPTNEWQKRRPADGMWHDIVNSSDKDRSVYTCLLYDGRIVTARLDKNREIESIEIDGKVDSLWKTALQEFEADPYQRETWPYR